MKTTLLTNFCYPLLFSSLLTLSCNNDTIVPIEEDNTPKLRALSLSEQELVKSSNDFAFDIFKQVNKEDKEKNIFISPLSIGTALAMTYNGAAGITKEEVKNVLGFERIADDELNKAYRDLQHLLLNLDKKTQLTIANAIWYRNSYSLKDGFSAVIKENYDGEIKPLDFNDPQAKNIINNWVKEKTQDKINNLVNEVRPEHVMFLVNAIYFKSDWTYKFDKSATKPMDFHLEDGTAVKRSMMSSDKAKFLYSSDEQVQLIDLPYGNQQFSMSILLPKENVSLNEVINGLSAERLRNLIQTSDTSDAELYMPKFKLEYEVSLNESLKEVGIKEAFTTGADFSNLFTSQGNFFVSEVKHKTFIEVDEEGTEAAAATSVGIGVTSITFPNSVYINRSFIFFIREKSSESILFAGKILDPQ